MAPRVLYHYSDPANRESIQLGGLSPDFDFTGLGAVYLSTEPLDTSDEADVWRVYTQGLDVVDDVSTPGFEGEWFMYYGVIPPERLELMGEWEKAAKWKKMAETYMGWPKFDRGDKVIVLGYGEKGTVDSAHWVEDRDEWWYRVWTIVDGIHELTPVPESDLERLSAGLDDNADLDQPSAWTLKDFGIPPEAEEYFRSAGLRDQIEWIRAQVGIDGEEFEPTRAATPWAKGKSNGMWYCRKCGEGPWDKLWYAQQHTQSRHPIAKYVTMDRMSANQAQLDAIRETYEADINARAATDALTAAGGRVFIVGGAVRDAFLGRPSKDVDLMCQGLTGDEIMAALSPLGIVKLTGEAFGVYRFRLPNTDASQEVEIALPRTERSTGAGHKDFEVQTDPYLDPVVDLQRRDFTGNAMAYDPVGNELLDPHGGADDLTAGRLRLVNDSALADDPLRIVRALVANARFGLQPDEDLLDALSANAHRLKSLPGERIQMEMDKLLAGDNPAGAMEIAAASGLIDYMVPELAAAVGFDQMNPHHDLSVYDHTMEVLRAAARLTTDPDIRLAALFHDAGKPESFWRDETAPEGGGGHFYKKVLEDGTEIGENHEEVSARLVEAFMKRLRYPNDRMKRVTTLCANHMFPYFKTEKGARKFLAALDGDFKLAEDLLTLREADASGKRDGSINERDRKAIDRARELLAAAKENNTAVTVKDLAVNGHDLMQFGLKGPQIGQAQKKLLEVIIDNPELNERESLLRLLRDGLVG
jgi:tRNA nucleotidyltransferase (CCA-adding enzyme)